jgi:diguanylate cyclase
VRQLSIVLTQYDWRFLVIAAFLGFLTALTTFRVYGRALTSRGKARQGWLLLNAAATGLGVWAANFTSMLAFDPNVAVAYDPVLAAAAMLVAMILAMPVGSIVLSSNVWRVSILGGLYIGLGIGAQQFVSFAAWNVAGTIIWHKAILFAALAVSCVLTGVALAVARPSRRWWERASGAALLTFAVGAQHLVTMSGMEVVPDPAAGPPDGFSHGQMALAVTTVTLLLVGAAFGLAALDRRNQRLSRRRMRELADAALEGLVMCENGIITDANAGFRSLVGLERDQLRGRVFADLVSPPQRPLIPDAGGRLAQVDLVSADGALVPVEIVARELKSGDASRRVLAVRDVRQLREAEARIRHLAHNDALTGLPNRVTFKDCFERALEAAAAKRGHVAVLCLDLDRFKEVNDVFGHAIGDTVLTETVQRLAAVLGHGDLLARLGGDEFAVLQEPVSAMEEPGAVAERLIAAMNAPFDVDGRTASVGVSVGVAIFPQHGRTVQDLLANADTALYRAKSDGGSTCRYFDQEMDSIVRSRRALAQDLRHAVAAGEIEVHYQPQVNARSGEIVGFEALSRWTHPERGPVVADELIAIAEEHGLMLELGQAVLQTACAEAARWKRPLKIAVNLSPVQFHQADLPERIAEILLRTGLLPSRLELEITETVLIKDFHRALNILRRIKALGVQIAMDDFGTGYSSLSALQAFPFDKLKIDRVFVDKVESRGQAATIVRTILSLGRNLSIPVVAEGVETPDQAAFLRQENCDELQGFLFGRPAPIADYAAVIAGTPHSSPAAVAPRQTGAA